MDVRNSRLIVVLASVFVVVVTSVAIVGIRRIRDSVPSIDELADADTTSTQRRPLYRRNERRSVSESDEQLSKRRLRELLDQRTRWLRERTDELRQTSLEHQALKNQFAELQLRFDQLKNASDQNSTLLVDLAAQISTETESDDQPANQLPDMPLVDVENGDAEAGRDAELTLIQWQLDVANERVRELENAVLREMVRSAEATRALVNAGDAAVPALVQLLADRNADVRVWAAEVLGRIGPPAANATESLIQAMSDSSLDVRKAAGTALDRIEGRS